MTAALGPAAGCSGTMQVSTQYTRLHLAAVLPTVGHLDVVHGEGGEVAAGPVHPELLHRTRLPAVKLENLQLSECQKDNE